MRIPVGPNNSRYAFDADKFRIDKTIKTRVADSKKQLSNPDGFPVNIDILQKTNNVVFKLTQNALSIILALEEGFLPENESATSIKLPDNITLKGHDLAEIFGAGKDGLQLSNEGLEDLVVKLVKAMNVVLGLANKEINQEAGSSRGLITNGDGLQTIKEIILSALNITEVMNDGSLSSSLLRVKLMANDLLSIDHQSLKDAISSNNGEVARTVRVVAQALCDTLPLCIDPNSGTLIYTGKRVVDDGDSKTSKALNAIDEELEKEKVELDTRLKVVDELISYSNKLIDDLMYQSAMITCEG